MFCSPAMLDEAGASSLWPVLYGAGPAWPMALLDTQVLAHTSSR